MVETGYIKKDIIIVGGGLTGCILLLALKKLNVDACLIEKNFLVSDSLHSLDTRSIALSQATKNVFETIGIWNQAQAHANPIDTIHISEAARFGSALLEKKKSPLGYTIEYVSLQNILLQQIAQDNIYMPYTVVDFDKDENVITIKNADSQKKLTAKLIVAADGANSIIRSILNVPVIKKTYDHVALATNIELVRQHQNIAYERFTPNGPMALLPLTNKRSGLIWSLKPEMANEVVNLSDKEFLKKLQNIFGYRLGRFKNVGRRTIFNLSESVTVKRSDHKVVFIGNACNTLHPVAGQGFNLGVRDVAALTQLIKEQGITENLIKDYYSFREEDHLAIRNFTNSLISIFQSKAMPVKHFRNLGLLAFDNIEIMKNLVSHYAQGFSGIVPDLACGISLEN